MIFSKMPKGKKNLKEVDDFDKIYYIVTGNPMSREQKHNYSSEDDDVALKQIPVRVKNIRNPHCGLGSIPAAKKKDAADLLRAQVSMIFCKTI